MGHPNWFIALPVTAGPWLARLRDPAPPPRVQPLHPDDLHLTVAFLGPVDEATARAAWTAARAAAPPTLTARLGPVVPLGDPRRPSALSASLDEGRDAVAAFIAAARDPLLDAAHAPRERRPPLPHVTLARVARRASDPQRADALAWASTLNLGAPSLTLDHLALYTWRPDPGARRFLITDVLPLTAR